MSIQLYYFDFKGLGEGLRYILHYGGLDFEDLRYPRDSYLQYRDSLGTPFGKLPMYKEGNLTLHQSTVIARYLASKVNLMADDPLEQAKTEAVVHTFIDFMFILRACRFEPNPVKKAQKREEILNVTIDYYYSKFEKQLAENNGFLGKKFTWADLYFVSLEEATCEHLQVDVVGEKYPMIKRLINKVHKIPAIKAYIQKRK